VDDWCFVEYPAPKGWVHARYLEIIDESAEEPAPDWVWFAESNTSRHAYYAPLLENKGDKRTLWVKSLPKPVNVRDWRADLPNGMKKAAYTKVQWIFQCADRTIATGSMVYYDASGTVLKSYPEDLYPRFSAILPETVSMAGYWLACK